MSFRLGLTGSIGMGKSTTAQMFVAEGCALWDADAAVHRLYAKGGLAVAPMKSAFPEAIEDNGVSRDRLREIIAKDPAALPRIESIVHPLVAQDRELFLAKASEDIVVLDIPLLFENESEKMMDAVAVVSVDADTQRTRVMARPGMTKERFELILSRQMPDREKRARADYVIETDTIDHARAQVASVVADIRRKPNHA